MTVIEKYIEELPEPQKSDLARVCTIVRQMAPGADEVFSYGVPTFKHHGKMLLAFAAHASFMSIYPASHAIAVVHDKLDGFIFSKGAVRFTHEHQLPDGLLKEIIRIRLDDIEARSG